MSESAATTTTTTAAAAPAAAAAAAAADGSAAAPARKMVLHCSDDQDVEVDAAIVEMSGTLRNMMEDLSDGADALPIPVPNVTSKIMQKVIEFCAHHHANPSHAPADDRARVDEPIDAWDQEFCKVDLNTLFELILAANYLDIHQLLDVTCKTIANIIKGKSPEEIRKTFNIKNDFTPEEEEQVRKENEWCEDR